MKIWIITELSTAEKLYLELILRDVDYGQFRGGERQIIVRSFSCIHAPYTHINAVDLWRQLFRKGMQGEV